MSAPANPPDVRAIWVIGHRNPDTDCTVAAIAYAALKQSQAEGDRQYVPAILGPLNPETRAVLARFGVLTPLALADVLPRVRDIMTVHVRSVTDGATLHAVAALMRERQIRTVPVIDADGRLRGVVTVDEIADRYLDELQRGARPGRPLGSMPITVRDLMRADVATVSADVLIEEAQRVLIEAKGRSLVVVDDDDRVVGLATRTDFLRRQRRRVILVDHSQRAQSVEGLETAEVVEIVDHHNIGDVTTGAPIFSLTDPVGATATLIAEMYLDPERWFHLPHPERVTLDAPTAGLLLSAIISDTLLLRSPTTTVRDRRTLAALVTRTGIDAEALAKEMFAARSDISARTAEELVGNDYKPYAFGGKAVGVAQVDVMSLDAARGRYDELRDALTAAKARQGLDLSVLMMTDIIGEATDLLFDPESRPIVERAFGVQATDGYLHLPGVVSRKKQLIPPLAAAL
ncbi:MAG: DHH family phosphoesterase [Thermomicrobia bacterium]|nr:DHH family phosphoesterase [Thermomicrobia bacterium]